MSENNSDWISDTLDKAVQDTAKLGVIPDELIEARAIWSVENKVLIGQVRQAGDSAGFLWFICGDLPTDHIGGPSASTPREALRHFSLKWQLDAQKYADPEVRKAHGLDPAQNWERMTASLVAKAEELYSMAEDEKLWASS